MFVKPTQGLVVRDPDTKRIIASEGAEVPESGYWMRRLRDGDVEITKPVTQSAKVQE